MSQHRELAKLVKDHDDPGRPSLIPGVPDIMGYVLTFLVCWGVYTLVVRTFSLIEEKKQEVHTAALHNSALAQKRSEIATKVRLGISEKFEKARGEIDHQNHGMGKIFDAISEAVRSVVPSRRNPPSENRF